MGGLKEEEEDVVEMAAGRVAAVGVAELVAEATEEEVEPEVGTARGVWEEIQAPGRPEAGLGAGGWGEDSDLSWRRGHTARTYKWSAC